MYLVWGIYLGEGLRHGVVVVRMKKVYMHGQAQFISQVSHALFSVNVIFLRVAIGICIQPMILLSKGNN